MTRGASSSPAAGAIGAIVPLATAGGASGDSLVGRQAVQGPLEALQVFGGQHLLGVYQESVLVHPREMPLCQSGGQFLADLLPSAMAARTSRSAVAADTPLMPTASSAQHGEKTMNESHDLPLVATVLLSLVREAVKYSSRFCERPAKVCRRIR